MQGVGKVDYGSSEYLWISQAAPLFLALTILTVGFYLLAVVWEYG